MNFGDFEFVPLERIPIESGAVFKTIALDSLSEPIKEIYFSEVYQYRVKPWRRHQKALTRIIVPTGKIDFIISSDLQRYDKISIGESNYGLLIIFPAVWFTFRGSAPKNVLMNLSSQSHDPNDNEQIDRPSFDDIWED